MIVSTSSKRHHPCVGGVAHRLGYFWAVKLDLGGVVGIRSTLVTMQRWQDLPARTARQWGIGT